MTDIRSDQRKEVPPQPSPPNRRYRVADFFERAGWSAGQQFFAVLLTATSAARLIDLPWALALSSAAGAAILSIIATAIQYLSNMTNLTYWPDLAVRLAKTFLASLAGTLTAAGFSVLTWDWPTALNLAAVATLGALGKGLLARGTGPGIEGRDTPSTMPTPHYLLAIR